VAHSGAEASPNGRNPRINVGYMKIVDPGSNTEAGFQTDGQQMAPLTDRRGNSHEKLPRNFNSEWDQLSISVPPSLPPQHIQSKNGRDLRSIGDGVQINHVDWLMHEEGKLFSLFTG